MARFSFSLALIVLLATPRIDAVLAGVLAEEAGGGEGRPDGSALVVASRSETAFVVVGVPYPNPTRGAAVAPFVLDETAEVEVAAYDVLGRRMATLAEGHFEAGVHRLALDASGFPAGVYVLRATVGDMRVFTQRLTVIR